MASAPAPPLPGSMTVPPLFGWEILLAVLLALVTLAALFFLVSATGRGADDRPDWEAWLDARSRPRPDRQGRVPNDGRPASSGSTR